jgi:small nuclear ribonucleoprotein (snRNP)-like protein
VDNSIDSGQKPLAQDKSGWEQFVGKVVVVDTDSMFVYLGTLDRVEDHFVVLKDVDAHDRRESPSTKEQYIMDTKKFGVKPNRREVNVRKQLIVSISRLDDILGY